MGLTKETNQGLTELTVAIKNVKEMFAPLFEVGERLEKFVNLDILAEVAAAEKRVAEMNARVDAARAEEQRWIEVVDGYRRKANAARDELNLSLQEKVRVDKGVAGIKRTLAEAAR